MEDLLSMGPTTSSLMTYLNISDCVLTLVIYISLVFYSFFVAKTLIILIDEVQYLTSKNIDVVSA